MADTTKVWDKRTSSVEVKVEKTEPVAYNATVSIISLLDARVIVTGTVTKKVYTWERAGTAQLVDLADKDEILNKKRGRACCGGQSGTALFQLE